VTAQMLERSASPAALCGVPTAMKISRAARTAVARSVVNCSRPPCDFASRARAARFVIGSRLSCRIAILRSSCRRRRRRCRSRQKQVDVTSRHSRSDDCDFQGSAPSGMEALACRQYSRTPWSERSNENSNVQPVASRSLLVSARETAVSARRLGSSSGELRSACAPATPSSCKTACIGASSGARR